MAPMTDTFRTISDNLIALLCPTGGNFKEMPQVTDPIVLQTPIVEKSAADLNADDLDDDESDVDIN